MEYNEIIKRLLDIRLQIPLSKLSLAKELGISYLTMLKICNNMHVQLRADTVRKIKKFIAKHEEKNGIID